MLRKTICVGTMALMFLFFAEQVQAQRRAPIRNLFRALSLGTGAGYHWRDPGHDTRYFNPWGEAYNYQPLHSHHHAFSDGHLFSDGQILYSTPETFQYDRTQQEFYHQPHTPVTEPGPSDHPPLPTQTSPDPTTRHWQTPQRPFANTGHSMHGDPTQLPTGFLRNSSYPQPGATPNSINGLRPTANENLRLNRYLRPFHSPRSSRGIELPIGGDFQIESSGR